MTSPNLRSAYGESLVRLGKKDERVVALEADLGKSTMSVMFQAEFADRYFQMGIAEQNMASTAAGFALAGKIPFIHSFAVFATGRSYDQIRNSICIPNLPVRICGSSAGLSDFGDGKTHQGVEDVALMRALPNMTVLCPADSIEVEKMMDCLLDWKGPVYIRINRNDLPFVTPPSEPYAIGKVTKLRDGSDAAIFAAGIMVSKALEAATALASEEISARVINVSTIKPLDRDVVIRHAAGVDAIVVAEEHSVIGGLGSAVVEALRSVRHAPVEFVGVPDSFGISAENYDVLLAHFGLTADAVAKAARTLFERGKVMNIGFIGLGIMGKPMAKNLLKAGHTLVVYDILGAPVKELVQAGATAGSSPKDVASKSGLVITMLPNSPHVREAVLGKNGVIEGAKPGSVLVDMSSIAPLASREMAAELAKKGIEMLDAPVSGGEPKAIDGTLAVMAGGKEAVFADVKDVLLKMAASAVLCGDIGAGNVTKLANQIIVALNIAAMSEAFVLATKAGVDPERVFDAVKGGLAGSTVLNAKAPMVLAGNYKPGFRIELHIKDLQNALDTAHESGVPIPLTSQVMEIMQALKVDGKQGEDHGGLIQFYEKLAGVKVRKGGAQ